MSRPGTAPSNSGASSTIDKNVAAELDVRVIADIRVAELRHRPRRQA